MGAAPFCAKALLCRETMHQDASGCIFVSIYSCREQALARLCLTRAPPCLEQAMQATRTCPWLVPQLDPLAP